MDNGNGVLEVVDMNNTNKYGGSSVSQPSLTIFSLIFDDAAKYFCHGNNDYDERTSLAVSLTVFGCK